MKNEKPDEITLRDYFAAQAITGMLTTSAAPVLGGLDGYEPYMAKAAYVIADEMMKAKGEIGWVKCSDRLPDVIKKCDILFSSQNILFVRDGFDDIHIGYRSDDDVFYSYLESEDLYIDDITHWMPFPEPPKGE